MKKAISFATAIALIVCTLPANAQDKSKDGKSPALKEVVFEKKGICIRAMLPGKIGNGESLGSDGSFSRGSATWSKELEILESWELRFLIPEQRSKTQPGPALAIPEKDPDGKFVEDHITAEAKRLEIKYDSITKVEVNGYVGRDAFRKPQMVKGFMGRPELFSGAAIRMFAVNKTLVSVEITWKADAPSKEAIKKVLDSFKIEMVDKK